MFNRLALYILFFFSVTLLQAQSIDKLLLDYNKTADSALRFELEQKLAWAYQEQQSYARAIEFFEKALGNKLLDTVNSQKIRGSIAVCYGELGDKKGEIAIREEMLRYGFPDKNQTVANIQALSGLYVNSKNYPRAVECNELLLIEAEALKDYNLATQAFNNLGYIWHLTGEPQKSSQYFMKSYAMATAPGIAMKDEDRAKVITNLGVMYAALGDLEQSQKYFNEALNLVRKQGDPVSTAQAINYKATGLYLKGEFNPAIHSLEEGVSLLEQAPETEEANGVRSDCYRLMAELMLKKRNISQFKAYQKKYDLVREKMLQYEKARNRLLVERQLETERQERDIQRLIAENQNSRVQLIESELEALQKEKELKQKQSELERLRSENELQLTRYQNQELEKARISQLLEIAQQKARDIEQQQKIDLLQKDKTLQDLTLAKSKKEIELLENAQHQEVKIREYSFVIIALLLLLLGVAVLMYFYRHKKNSMLAEQNYRINNMNQEILAQNEELTSMNEVLNERTEQVEKQNEKLTEAQKIIAEHNKTLEAEIDRRIKEIKDANIELTRYNHQLEQFAYTVSHNLRGPIARLLGLSNLIRKTTDDRDREFMLDKIEQSSADLDDIIKDLEKILDIKNSKERIIEAVDLEEKFSLTCIRLETMIEESGAQLFTDFNQVRMVYSSGACIDNVFYNLISNAIKYRSRQRVCKIEVRAFPIDGAVEIVVEDNGIGIDLARYGGKLFGLYKRFNIDTEGKGLGLYLVKAEVESLHGHIEVESILDQGTRFKITLPNHRPGTYSIKVA